MVAALPSCGSTSDNAAATSVEQGDLEQVPVTIHSRGQAHRFTVDMARSAQEQEKGQTDRTSLALDGGMIFPFVPARPVTWSTKNMKIPVDIVFIRPDGTVANVAANAAPGEIQPVVSTEAVSAVVEIAAGRAAALGIAAGDRVEWPR